MVQGTKILDCSTLCYLSPVYIFVNIFCTFSSLVVSLLLQGDQNCKQYSTRINNTVQYIAKLYTAGVCLDNMWQWLSWRLPIGVPHGFAKVMTRFWVHWGFLPWNTSDLDVIKERTSLVIHGFLVIWIPRNLKLLTIWSVAQLMSDCVHCWDCSDIWHRLYVPHYHLCGQKNMTQERNIVNYKSLIV